MASPRILLFAKAPQLGRVKTRMAAKLNPEQSLALHQSLTHHCLKNLIEAELAEVELWGSSEDEWLQQLAEHFGVPFYVQNGSDLGARMHHALDVSLAHSSRVLIVGADCPFITPSYLRLAIEALAEVTSPVVLGPALDGGYVLLGATSNSIELFRAVEWGSARVLEQTRERLKQLRWGWSELEPLTDIDRPEDLAALVALPELRGWSRLI